MMFFDEIPPDTSTYMVAGYAIFFIITAIYLVSLFIRTRNLNRDLLTLESLQKEQEAAIPAPVPSRPKPTRTKSSKAKQPQKKNYSKK